MGQDLSDIEIKLAQEHTTSQIEWTQVHTFSGILN